MRKLGILGMGLAFATVSTLSSGALAQDQQAKQIEQVDEKEPSKGGVWFNPLALIFGAVSADVGIALGEKHALNFGASYWSFDLLGVENTSFGFGAGWQYFITGSTFGGFFVLPNLQLEYASIKANDVEASGLIVGPGALLGYQWDWQPFSLRLGGGIQYYIGSVEATSGSSTVSSDIAGLSPALDASIGFTW